MSVCCPVSCRVAIQTYSIHSERSTARVSLSLVRYETSMYCPSLRSPRSDGCCPVIRKHRHSHVCHQPFCSHVCHGTALLYRSPLNEPLFFFFNLCRMAIWGRARHIVIPLTLALIGFAGVLLRGIIGVRDIWVPASGCTIVSSQQTILRTIYIYGMSLDMIVLLLTLYRLGFGKERSPLMKLLLADGLVYFIITYVCPFCSGIAIFASGRLTVRHEQVYLEYGCCCMYLV